MNLNPRLPDLPEAPYGVDPADHPVSLDFLRQFYERYYRLHRDTVQEFARCVPVTGSWTPVLTFATPGDLAVTYTIQVGSYTRVGTLVEADFTIQTSAFTWTTSAGAALITGLPVTAINETNQIWVGKPLWSGITFSVAGYTDVFMQLLPNTSQLKLAASGSGKAAADLVAADLPTAGTVILRGTIIYRATP